MVGAYYYPWWGAAQGGHTFDETVRAHTTPNTQLPVAGTQYNSRNANVIAEHIDQSHLGNISMWSMSWWGPNSFEDTTIRNHILPHARSSELSYTVHYESTGRLGSFGSPNYSNLIPDFRHLADNVFSDPNYMRIDGRPVVVMYLSRVYFDDATGAAALTSLRNTIQAEYGYDPYIIGDHLFNNVAAGPANVDAITSFDVYGQVFKDGVVNQAKINQLNNIYSNAQAVANNAGVDFVPGVAPGYNDKAVRAGNLPAARYFPGEEFGSVFEAMLNDAALPNTDADINDLILVNSFNEWHEDTQIEASVVGPATNTDDTSTGMELTVGRFYEGYGTRYLDILRNATQTVVTTPAEIRWGRGTASGMFVGNFTDLANWNADDVTPDPPRIPGPGDRARVDRSGTNMTIDSTIIANEFLFGVDEAGQTFVFEAGADVSLASNLFVSFNSGSIDFDVRQGASILVGGNFLVGQHDGKQNGQQLMNDEDITVTIAGSLEASGSVILGDRYGNASSATSMDVDVLLDIAEGTLRTADVRFAPNGDLDRYLDIASNNTMGIRIGQEGTLVIVGSDATAKLTDFLNDGLLYTDDPSGTINITFDGSDTLVQVVVASLPGDYNQDGIVDASDYTVWRDSLGQSGNGLAADGNNSGTVDLADYLIWKQNFASASGSALGRSSVPEPASLLLTATVVCLYFSRQFRR